MNNKAKQFNRKAAVKLADKIFSRYIRKKTQKEYGGCAFCGKPIDCNFHFFSRVAYSTRWDEDNAIGSCIGCNMRMEYAPYPFYVWFREHRGQDKLDALNRKHNTIAKLSTADLLEIVADFKRKLEAQ